MVHPRLSINAMCSFPWSFEQDLALWSSTEVRHAGLLFSKLEDDPETRMTELTAAGIRASTVIVEGFDLSAPETWEQTHENQAAVLDLAARHAVGSIYFTPGRTCGKSWNDDLDRFADAVSPTVAYARKVDIRAAIEPSLRTSVSFVNTLRDAIDVAERTGIDVIADFGNMWMERDFREVIARAMPHIALVQWCDLVIGSPGRPTLGGRVHVGDGELPLRRMIMDVLAGGYTGVFDLEVVPLDFTQGGREEDVRRGIARASELLMNLCP
jgi:sugar phosphate isomerase/epimerase